MKESLRYSEDEMMFEVKKKASERPKQQGRNQPVALPEYRPSGIDMIDEVFSEENVGLESAE